MDIRAHIALTSSAFLVALPSPASAAKEPVRLGATSQWRLDYADDSCRLARRFGEGEAESLLIFDRFEPGEGFKLIATGMPFEKIRDHADATIRFGSNEAEQDAGYFAGELNGKPAMIFAHTTYLGLPSESERAAAKQFAKDHPGADFEYAPVGPEREAAVGYLSIDAPGIKEIVLETGSMKAPMDALRRCTDELLEHWGIDVAAHHSLTRKAMPTKSPADWLTSADYPSKMLRQGAQSIIQFRIDVDSAGKPSGCHIQTQTNPAGFNDVVCAGLMKRARFRPALDAVGNPVASYYINSVIFLIAG